MAKTPTDGDCHGDKWHPLATDGRSNHVDEHVVAYAMSGKRAANADVSRQLLVICGESGKPVNARHSWK
jgi:hypothetical protein